MRRKIGFVRIVAEQIRTVLMALFAMREATMTVDVGDVNQRAKVENDDEIKKTFPFPLREKPLSLFCDVNSLARQKRNERRADRPAPI